MLFPSDTLWIFLWTKLLSTRTSSGTLLSSAKPGGRPRSSLRRGESTKFSVFKIHTFWVDLRRSFRQIMAERKWPFIVQGCFSVIILKGSWNLSDCTAFLLLLCFYWYRKCAKLLFVLFQVQDGQEQVVLPEAQILTSLGFTNKCLKMAFDLLTLYWYFLSFKAFFTCFAKFPSRVKKRFDMICQFIWVILVWSIQSL